MVNLLNKHRRSIRLGEVDYSLPGAYFITIVTQGRICLFGNIYKDAMVLNDFGTVVQECWNRIPSHFDNAETATFVIMPNHVHGIVHLFDATCRGKACLAPTDNGVTLGRFVKPVPGSLPTIVGSFKSAVSKRINELRSTRGVAVWQRNYYEHIIRSDEEYLRIEKYIYDNPLNWNKDDEYPAQNRQRHNSVNI